MSNAVANTNEQNLIAGVVQHYIDGAKSGSGDDMKIAFHPDATIFGYAGENLFGGPIQSLFDWNDDNGPATGLEASIANVDITGTVATVRLELSNWTGHRYTDLFTDIPRGGSLHSVAVRNPEEGHRLEDPISEL